MGADCLPRALAAVYQLGIFGTSRRPGSTALSVLLGLELAYQLLLPVARHRFDGALPFHGSTSIVLGFQQD